MTDLTTRTMNSPWGLLTLTASASGLTAVSTRPSSDWSATGSTAARAVLDATETQLTEYFAGRRRRFELPLAPRGTVFQQRVWRQLLEIPYGETSTYGELARALGHPGAARAVGAANGRNPLWIVVPCHRVIGTAGRLTGFAGGLVMKQALLTLERGAGRDSLTGRAFVL